MERNNRQKSSSNTNFINPETSNKTQVTPTNTEINLEKVLLVEDKIWTLLEVHRFLERVSKETSASQS